MLAFECLYFLDNLQLSIIEVKLNGLPDNATAAEKFHWLKIEKESMVISPLTFGAMDSSGEVEERYFEEGFLKFNSLSGTFIEKYNSAQHPLTVLNCNMLPAQIANSIASYFSLETSI